MKDYNWKDIFTVAIVVAVVQFVFGLISEVFEFDWDASIIAIGIIGAGLILHKRLKSGQEWGILIGSILSQLVVSLLWLVVESMGLF